MTFPASLATAADNRAGILFMLAAMAGFALNDACVKLAGETLPMGEIIVLRGLVATPLILAVAWRRGAFVRSAHLRDRAVIWRTIAEVAATGLFIAALLRLPLANVTAILQTVPLMTTAAAALVLGEAVGLRRWLAVLAGFLGVLVIVRPGASGFDAWSLLALACALAVMVRDLASRALPPGIPTLSVACVAAPAVTAFGAMLMPFEDWSTPDARSLGLAALAGLFLSGAYVCIVSAMRAGDVAAVTPFRYTILLWALVLQVVVFGVLPDAATLAGSAILVATGLYAFHRERLAHARTLAGDLRAGPVQP